MSHVPISGIRSLPEKFPNSEYSSGAYDHDFDAIAIEIAPSSHRKLLCVFGRSKITSGRSMFASLPSIFIPDLFPSVFICIPFKMELRNLYALLFINTSNTSSLSSCDCVYAKAKPWRKTLGRKKPSTWIATARKNVDSTFGSNGNIWISC
ncbi:hypothetical protein RvY_05168-1 [Ramazzottius varieornatus]|uniref:Uncharacterized protein n=1 Tax=Ramazzottius varieornatus TaxID=947166 RepID=A0A1D1UX66_RAMVA|nr:hypothetical protein RvY_05168-1 [Ramazzottius varieornatus]